ncbi:MAG: AAA family ATPase [Pseudomonadota bacterium]
MYIESFKLKELPFRLSPDPEFLFLSKNHSRAKAYMESTIWFTDGFVIITGEIGAGKTTLIETFLQELEKDVVVAQISQTQISATEFLQAALVQFGINPFKMGKAELLTTLNGYLVEQYSAGRKVLLIVDEAQNLTLDTLEEIRMLSGVETTKDKVLRIILAGQPELNEKLDSPELVQLEQRVRLRFHLTALSPEDLQGYVLHRLEVAGSNGRKLFADDCYPLLYRYTGGVPRLINTLCDTAMVAAFTADRDHVLLEDVHSAIKELRWIEFSARVVPRRRPVGDAARGQQPPTGDTTRALLRIGGDEPLDTGKFPGLSKPLAKLVVVADGKNLGELALREGRTVIGRTADNDLQIDSRFVSRHHCQIVTKPNSCVVEDLNSTNGIVVKSRRVRSHNLNDGDVITIGRHDLIYVDERGGTRSGRTDSHKALPDPDAGKSEKGPDSPAQHGETQVL